MDIQTLFYLVGIIYMSLWIVLVLSVLFFLVWLKNQIVDTRVKVGTAVQSLAERKKTMWWLSIVIPIVGSIVMGRLRRFLPFMK
ncbi:hypothetical protein HGA88_02345 [Candidatus Roizmanbacteria bacterium]|nr:hypothetical protein [Candidatus Roizmanbacteria bacterium]